MTRSERIVTSLMHGFTSPILFGGVVIVSALVATFNLWAGALTFTAGIVFWCRVATAIFESGLRFDNRCIRCGYNLTGLPEPRCPECGRPFEPAEGDAP